MSGIHGRERHRLGGYFLFGRRAVIGLGEMPQRRARWPRWRRTLVPVGAALFWGNILLGFVLPDFNDPRHAGPVEFVLALVMTSCLIVCVLLGVGLEWRDRRREGRRIFG